MVLKSTLKDVIETQTIAVNQLDKGLERLLLDNIGHTPKNFALIISGIRRCGKSTLIYQFISKYIDATYLFLNFDTAKLYTFDVEDFQILDQIIDEMSTRWLLFDEIQVVEGWEIYVRQKIDEGYQVLITGSNASLLSQELGTKLTGRQITKELYPFSFTEYSKFNTLKKTEEAFQAYVDEGGFPGYLKSKNIDVLSMLIDDILHRDIAVRYQIRDVKSLKNLIVFLATNTGKLVSANKLKQVIGVKSTTTISEYFSYFESTYLVQFVSKFSYSHKVQLVNPKKVYFIDTGLQQVLSTSFTEDYGRKLETIVYWELKRQDKTLYYYYEKGKECDFVVCKHQKVEHLIQVCYHLNRENQKRELAGLVDAMTYFDIEIGFIITFNQNDMMIIEGKRIEIVPVYEYF